jgi:hypothetical protein
MVTVFGQLPVSAPRATSAPLRGLVALALRCAELDRWRNGVTCDEPGQLEASQDPAGGAGRGKRRRRPEFDLSLRIRGLFLKVLHDE